MSQPGQGRVSFESLTTVRDAPRSPPMYDERMAEDYFSADGSVEGARSPGRRRASLSIKIPPSQPKADMAMAALQYLPMPIMVLGSDKSVVLANEAMGRLLGVDVDAAQHSPGSDGLTLTDSEGPRGATDILYGTTLAQLGVDLLLNGSPVFVAWEEFLETVVDDAARAQSSLTQLNTYHPRDLEDEAPTPTSKHRRSTSASSSARQSHASGSRTEVHDAVMDVVFSTDRDPKTGLPSTKRQDVGDHVQSQMIVSVWATEDDVYYTLTFTAARSEHPSPASSEAARSTTTRTVSRTPTTFSTSLSGGMSSNSSSGSRDWNGRRRSNQSTSTPTYSPGVASPHYAHHSHALEKGLQRGPPGKGSAAAAPTMFNKMNRLKDALMNSMNIPAYAMWKDESFGLPNKAAIRLLYPWIEDGAYDSSEQARDFLARYTLYRDDFSEEIPVEEFPIMRLMREQLAFGGYRVGMYSAKDGSRLVFDASGLPLLDDKGEFLGGVVLFQDVTDYAATITRQQQENARQFEDMANMIPQMIWRTDPEGNHDYYSERWYSYTGLSVEESHGLGWLNAFHPDDIEVAKPIWAHSLATGEEYLTEYRCKSAEGHWRWMLGRALPMRDGLGNIVKWFGTCTDIHEQVLAREDARQTRAQLERVVDHARMTLWAVDKNYKLTLFQGRPMHSRSVEQLQKDKSQYLGKSIWDIFELQGRKDEISSYRTPLDRILSGQSEDESLENQIASNQRYFRTRMFPLLRQERKGALHGDEYMDGVVGVSMDVTETRRQAQQITERDLENTRLMAQSVAAKEASKMKSQFLANMSHEIRTPIAGVIGMSELLLDDDTGQLTQEQRECTENIQRSANGLLTVINDILDFSKVESGRLDIEEVQFDLSVVIRDVNKMLSFAAERKGLKYVDDIQQLKNWKVMGDPGRLRQVMTNLLTNSIKFTSNGSVTMRVSAEKETADVVEVHFTVEDTGIGIEEEVRQRLFRPFSQADSSTARRFGGTGLGLTISKNLVELMHGSISLESKLGVGTKATFCIPFNKAAYTVESGSPIMRIESIPDRLQSEVSVSRAASETSGAGTPTVSGKPSHTRAPSGSNGGALTAWQSNDDALYLSETDRKKVNVLVVEDNAINQQIALKTIRKLGFPVQAVWNGKEALDYLQQPTSEQYPRPDVILMDCQMPIMDGYRATYTIRNSQPFAGNPALRDTPIVAMTASAIQGDREKCQASGMDDYLAKPVKKPNLERMLIKWAIEGKRKRALSAQQLTTRLQRPETGRAPSSFASDSTATSPAEHLASELDRLQYAERSAAQRVSETPSDKALRQQRAEEKAMSLRDDALMQSAEDPKWKTGRGISDEGFEREKESTPVGSGNALTIENMQRHSGIRIAKLQRDDSLEQERSSSAATTGEDDETGQQSISRSITPGGDGLTPRRSAPGLSNKPPSFYAALLVVTLLPLWLGSYQYRLRHPYGGTSNAVEEDAPHTSAEFIRDWLGTHVVEPFNPSAIASYCNQSDWHPNLVFNLDNANGGVGNIRGNFLDFIFYAIEAGASIMLPGMAARSQADISNVWADRAPFDLMFDEEWFLWAMGQACPQMAIYKPEKGQKMTDALPGNYSPPGRRMDTDRSSNKEAYLEHLDAWLKSKPEFKPDNLTLVNLERTLWNVDTRSLPRGFRKSFGQLLHINPTVRRLAAIAVESLASEHYLHFDPRAAIPKAVFAGVHLRTELDAQNAGWLNEPNTNFSAQTDAYIEHTLKHKLNTIYVASGNATDLARFKAKAAAHAPPLNVTSKLDLLPPPALAELKQLTWDQQALVDFEVLQRCSVFGGVVKSSFSYGIALTRNQWLEDQGRVTDPWFVMHNEVGVAFDDGISRILGRDGWHELRIPRGMWP